MTTNLLEKFQIDSFQILCENVARRSVVCVLGPCRINKSSHLYPHELRDLISWMARVCKQEMNEDLNPGHMGACGHCFSFFYFTLIPVSNCLLPPLSLLCSLSPFFPCTSVLCASSLKLALTDS